MAAAARFTIPYPLGQQELTNLTEQVVATRVSNEGEKAYFLSSLVYLLRFANENIESRRNVTMGVGMMTEEKDGDQLWRKDRLWVKVKLTGGTGPRVNFMATSYGIAQVNWKANTRVYLGSVSVHAQITVLEQFPTHSLFTGFTSTKEPSPLFHRTQSMRRYSQATAAFGDILSMSQQEVSSIVNNPTRLGQIATELFAIFDEDRSNSIDHKEFIKFFSNFLHQPIEATIETFNQVSNGTGKITVTEFRAVLELFLNQWIANEKSKWLALFWNCVLNLVMELPADKRAAFQTDGKRHRSLFENMLNAAELPMTVQFGLYRHLTYSLDRALHRPLTSEPTIRGKFTSVAQQGAMSVDNYMKVFTAGLGEVYEFVTDWEACQRVYRSTHTTTYEEAVAWVSTPDGSTAVLSQVFRLLGAETKLDFQALVRFNRCSSIPAALNVPEGDRASTELSLPDAVNAMVFYTKKMTIEDVDFPGRFVFVDLAGKKPIELIALTIEEFRLRAIAHDVFLTVYPVRDRHDFSTFQRYASCMCEAFQVENATETVAALFTHFSTEGGMTERDFALCLRQMIGHQLKWAQSREIQLAAKKENIVAMMQDEGALRAFAKHMFDAVDANCDGAIDRCEFKQAIVVTMGDPDNPFKKTDDEVNKVFDRLDTNGDGLLSAEEYQVFVQESLVAFLNS